MNSKITNKTHNVPLTLAKFCSRKWLLSAMMLFLISVSIKAGEILLKDITVTPRWPWNGLVDITYSVEIKDYPSDFHPTEVWVSGFGKDYVKNETVEMKTLTGEGIDTPVLAGGPYTIVWDAGKDVPNFNSTDFTVTLYPLVKWHTTKTYLKINLEDWSYDFRDGGPNVSNDTCRTTELWLRRIPRGTFTMGSPEDELGRNGDEVQHQVTLTQDYYIGVFEMTQKQYELVTGSNPSDFKGDTRPVECVSYYDLRGTSAEGGAGWPAKGHAVDVNSFFGVLRAKTGLVFDLPTEAQWEYACRAGTTTALNSGKNLTATVECPNLRRSGGTTTTETTARAGTPSGTPRWAATSRTPGVSTTCTAMSGSGASTGMAATPRRRSPTPPGQIRAPTGCCAAAAGTAKAGTTTRSTAVPQAATASTRRTATTSAASGSSAFSN